MAELVDAVGPDRAEVYHHKMDGTSFTEYFPWELTNTDYYRRVLAQVGYSLRALVSATVKAHGVVVVGWIDWVKLKIRRPKIIFQTENIHGEIGCDAQTLIKHVLHGPHFKTYASLLGCTTSALQKQLKDALNNLKTGRNDFAHMSLTSDTRWLDKTEMKCIFDDAKFVVKRAGAYLGHSPNYAAENLERLETQWETHTKSKHQRQNAIRLARTVFVRVLKEHVTEAQLRTAAEQCGFAVAQTLVGKSSLGQIGYVEFAEDGDLKAMAKALKNQLQKKFYFKTGFQVTQSTKYLIPKPPVSTPAPPPSGPLGVNSDRCRVVF